MDLSRFCTGLVRRLTGSSCRKQPANILSSMSHCSNCEPYTDGQDIKIYELPPNMEDNKVDIQPGRILAQRNICQNGQNVNQVLISWEGTEEADNTLEDYDSIYRQFSGCNLEDKVDAKRGYCH